MDKFERAQLYKRIFLNDPDGQKILEDLVAKFYDVEIFVKGGQDGDRETARRAGSRKTVGYILSQLGHIGEENEPSSNGDNSDDSGSAFG